MVLAFLRDTKAGEFVSLAALGGGAGVEAESAAEEGDEGEPGLLSNVYFLCLSLVRLLSLLESRGAGD